MVPTVIKTEPGEDIKPKRLRTEILEQKSLLRWEGTGDEEVIITTVQKGNNPLGRYFEDTAASQQIIEVEESDSEDDLSMASLQSEGDVNREELKGVLQGLAESHQQTATHLGTMSTMVTGMSEDTVGDIASRVASDMGAIKGWHHILDSFDRAQIALVLAVGVRRVEEFEILKGLWPKDDVTPFLRLAKIFGSNTRTIQECYAGMKYWATQEATATRSRGNLRIHDRVNKQELGHRHYQDRRRVKRVVHTINNHNFRSFSGPPHIPKGEALKSCEASVSKVK